MTERDDSSLPPTVEALAAALLREIGTTDVPETILTLARQLNAALARQAATAPAAAISRDTTGEA